MSKLITKENLYSVIHKQFATDRFEFGTTIVESDSERNAMKKLNNYLDTKPDGEYTDLKCEGINHVSKLDVLC